MHLCMLSTVQSRNHSLCGLMMSHHSRSGIKASSFRSRFPSIGKTTPPILDGLNVSCDEDGNTDHYRGQGDGGGPEHPLRPTHVTDVGGVHTEEGGDEGEGEKNDGDDGEDEDGAFLAVAIGFDAVEVLTDEQLAMVQITSS